MNLAAQRVELLAKRAAITGVVPVLSRREGVGASTVEDLEVGAVTDQVAVTLSQENSNILRMIDRALLRVEKGGYGICECGDVIAENRLTAVPWAQKCLTCAEVADSKRRSRS